MLRNFEGVSLFTRIFFLTRFAFLLCAVGSCLKKMNESETTITFTNDPYDPYVAFTNSYPAEFQHLGKKWATVDHFYHAIKFFPKYPDLVEEIRTAESAKDAAEIADCNRDCVRKDWKEIHISVMDAALE